jgi:hypothetical protein
MQQSSAKTPSPLARNNGICHAPRRNHERILPAAAVCFIAGGPRGSKSLHNGPPAE